MILRVSQLITFVQKNKYIVPYYGIRPFQKSVFKKANLKFEVRKWKKDVKRINNKLTEITLPSEFPKWQFTFIISGFMFICGISYMVINVRRLKNGVQISSNEFVKEYLEEDKVLKVIMPGFISRYFSGITAEIILKPHERHIQSLCIPPKHNLDIRNLIRTRENDLKVPKSEKLKIKKDLSETCVMVLFMIQFLSYVFLNIWSKTSFLHLRRHQRNALLLNQKYGAVTTIRESLETKIKAIFEPVIVIEEVGEKSEITFNDVAGLHSAKQEVLEFIDYLIMPKKINRLGARLPKGVLLYGPPGCGKTLLIKALANESGVPFYYKAGSELDEIYAGLGASKVRMLFNTARRNSPAIIFIDEIDAIGKKRSSGGSLFSSTLIQLLVEMDGMENNSGIVVFAATNRYNVLDDALVRPGRLDRHILIDYPTLKEREEILEYYLEKCHCKLESKMSNIIDFISPQCSGMSGADIGNIVNEAAIMAVRLDYNIIKDHCFLDAIDRINIGVLKKNQITAVREYIAYHEAGHALLGMLLTHVTPIIKASILQKTNGSQGFVEFSPSETTFITPEMLKDKLIVSFGGFAAESLIFNDISAGSQNDLQNVRELAYSMIRDWGMSEILGHVSYKAISEEAYIQYSEKTRELIDSEVNTLVTFAYKRAEFLLQENSEKLALIAKGLLAKDVLYLSDLEKIMMS